MSKAKCSDTEKGELKHAYELGALSVEDTEKFEIHLLECESCFESVREFERAATLMRTDTEIRQNVRMVVDGISQRKSLLPSLVRYLWPQTPLVFKPAVAFFVMALLIYPAYLGMRGSGDSGMRQIQSISLLPTRASTGAVLKASSGQDGLISFVYPGAIKGHVYRLAIESEDGKVVMSEDSFAGFDEYETGYIVIPIDRFGKGTYRLVISDTESTNNYSEQVYVFEIE
jgi:phage shock protein PspC (stress-responsive transcriptional regulator)